MMVVRIKPSHDQRRFKEGFKLDELVTAEHSLQALLCLKSM